MLSRNFRLQKVGDLDWLQKNYNFSKISFAIDELIVLDVSRENQGSDEFAETLKKLTEGCFMPIAAGGGIRSIQYATKLLRSGADKVVINTPLFSNQSFIYELSQEFGQQCIVGSIDIKKNAEQNYNIYCSNGGKLVDGSTTDILEKVCGLPIGELYLNSINQDGTGQGFDQYLLELLPKEISMPVIMAGGAGNSNHLAEGLGLLRVDAVATAHLFNFVGDGLEKSRLQLLEKNFNLAVFI